MSYATEYAAATKRLLEMQAARAQAEPIRNPCVRCGVIQPNRSKYCGDCRPNHGSTGTSYTIVKHR